MVCLWSALLKRQNWKKPRLCVIVTCCINRLTVMDLRAGRLMPAARVEVQARRQSTPDEYASSSSFLSSLVRPLWWYARPKGTVFCSTGHNAPFPLFLSSESRVAFSSSLCLRKFLWMGKQTKTNNTTSVFKVYDVNRLLFNIKKCVLTYSDTCKSYQLHFHSSSWWHRISNRIVEGSLQ